MIRLLWRTDLHLAETSPRSRLDDWKTTLLARLVEIGEIAKRENVDAVIDGGDFFHVKSPSKTSHQLVAEVMRIHRDYPCPVYSCVGNHDCVYGDYEYLSQQPLGVLFDSGTFKRLYDKHEARFQNIRVVGVPYHGTDYDLSRFESIKRGSEDVLIVVGHVLATPGKGGKGAMFKGEDIVGYDFLKTLDADVFAFGHWHKDQGVSEISPGKHVINVGSLSRGSLSQDNLSRKPCVVVINISEDASISFDRIDLNVKPASEVFDIEMKQRIEQRELSLETFSTSLKDVLHSRQKGVLEDSVRSLDIPDRVKEKVLFYLEHGAK